MAPRSEIEQLREEVHELRKSVEGLVEAWNTAKGVVVFVKWVAGALTAVGIIWAAIKGHLVVGLK